MTSNYTYSIQPYFYIIQHIPSGVFYAGCKYGKDANPNNFMKPGGYTTSSDRKDGVNDLIAKDGLESFQIIDIILEEEIQVPFGCQSVYEYETWFLQSQNIAGNPNWLNCHNNKVSPWGSIEFKIMMNKLYGVEHCSNIPGIYEKMKHTMLDRYGVDNPFKSPEIMAGNAAKRMSTMLEKYGSISPYLPGNNIVINRKKTCLERYGVEHYSQLPSFIEENVIKVKSTKLAKYGDENYNNQEKNRETKLAKYGDENFNNRDKSKQTCLEKYGVENAAQSEENRRKNSELLKSNPIIKCNICNREGKSPSIFRHIAVCERKNVGASASYVWQESNRKFK